MKTRIEQSPIVGGYNLVSERTDKVLVFGESMIVCSNVQAELERDTFPESEAAEVAAFIAEWSDLL